MNLQELRQKYPDYNDMSDEQFAKGFHKKYYGDMDFGEFSKKIGYTQTQTKAQETSEIGDMFKKLLFGDKTPDETQRNSQLVNQIPGIGKEQPLPEKSQGILPNILGAGEAALSQAAGLGGSMLAWPLALAEGGINAAKNKATGGKEETSPPKLFEKFMEGMYQPKTEAGKEQNKWVNENITRHLMGIVPATGPLETLAGTKQLRKVNEGIVGKSKLDAAKELIAEQVKTEQAIKAALPENRVGPTNEMVSGEFPPLGRQLSEAGLVPDFVRETPEQPLPFVPELYKEEAPRIVGKTEAFNPTVPEAERVAAAREAELSQPLPFERTPIEPQIPDYVPQEPGMPFTVEGKLSTPVEVARASRDVQGGMRDVAELTGDVNALKEQAAKATELGPEQQLAIQGLEHDLSNAQGRTAAGMEAATQIGRDLGQLKVDTGAGPRTPALVGPNRGRFGQGGAVDPSVILSLFPSFKGSKLVDSIGNLRVLYHGTSKDKVFDSFSNNKRGTFLGDDPTVANMYARDNESKGLKYVDGKYKEVNTADRVIPVYANLQNPYIFSPADAATYKTVTNYAKFQRDLKTKAEALGHDGYIDPGGAIVVFDPKNIVSATSPVNKQMLGQTQAGKGQRGSIGFFGDKSKKAFDEFSRDVLNSVPGATPEMIREAWNKTNNNKELAKQEAKNNHIYGNPLTGKTTVGNDVPVQRVPVEKVISDLESFGDSTKGDNFYEKWLMSSGYMKAIAADNPAVAQGIRYLKGIIDWNSNRAEKALYRQANSRYGHDSGIILDMTKLEKLFSPGEAAELFKQWFAAKDNPDYKFNFNERQQKIHEKWQALSGKMLEDVNSKLPENRKLESLPNYIPSVHTGRYVLEVSKIAPDGSRTRPILWGFENKHAASFAAKRLGLTRGDLSISKVKDRGANSEMYKDSRENRAANYQYMLEMMTDANPEVVALGKELMKELQSTATTTRGRHQHFKEYQGFAGELGNNPLKSDRQNYYDGKRMIEEFVKSHYDWMTAQEGADFVQRMTDSGKVGPNNFSILNNYVNDSLIGNRIQTPIDSLLTDLGTAITGSSATQQKGALNTVGNVMTAFMTSMGSATHAIQNVVQPLTVILPQMLRDSVRPDYYISALSKGGAEYAYLFLGKQAGELAKLFGADAVNILGTEAFNAKMKYAERTGIISPTIVDARSMFGNKFANRTSQFGMQGLISRPTEQAARWTVFSTMADFYQKIGHNKEEAFNKAREITENYMVDYSPDAKAKVWKDMGFVGNLAGRLQSFATNNFSQAYTYGKRAAKGGAGDKLAFAGFLTALGVLGGVAGLPAADAIMSFVDWLSSKDGKQFSSRNYLRKTVGNFATEGVWSQTPYGMAPSFGSRSVNTDGSVPLPAMLGVPSFGKIPEIGRTVGRRAFGESPWGSETEAEKGRELLSVTPTVARGVIEDKYLTENVANKKHNISPMTGKVLHTDTGNEQSLGNIRSSERARDTELANERFNEEGRFQEQKKKSKAELDGLIRDIYQYGNGNAQKELRFLKNYSKYVRNFAGDPSELDKVLNDIRPYVSDEYVAKLAQLSRKENPNLEDVRQLRKVMEYKQLKYGR